MAKKEEKVSIRKFDEAIKAVYVPESVIDWNGVEVRIKRCLSFAEMFKFIDTVVSACFADDGADYYPEAMDYALKACTIVFYTNITLSSNIEKMYDEVYHSGIVQEIIQYIDASQYDAIFEAIGKKIAHKTDARAEAMNKQAQDIYTFADNIRGELSGLFEGVSKEDISNVIGAISEGKVDEELLMKAYLDHIENDTSGIA